MSVFLFNQDPWLPRTGDYLNYANSHCQRPTSVRESDDWFSELDIMSRNFYFPLLMITLDFVNDSLS